MNKKILYIFDALDWRSRMPVAEEAKAQGYEVVIALIGSADDVQAQRVEGFTFIPVETPPGQFRGLSLFKMVSQIRAIIKDQRPALLHAVTLKYSFISGLAALPYRALHKVYTLAGLGYLFRGGNPKATLIRKLLSPLLKIVFSAARTHLIFQNPDDLALLIDLRYVTYTQSTVIRGSGVDLTRFTMAPLEVREDEPLLVLMPTRLVREKGVHIFIEAARMLKQQGINARFEIAGGETKHNPRAISAADMNAMTADGAVKWLGRVEDMPALLAQAALIVYPSYYGEGIPRVLLEACAAGRAIITTDHAGCKETVDHGDNGYLVPTRNHRALADAIAHCLKDPALLPIMGKNSRSKAESEFDIKLVVTQTTAVYAQLT